VTGYRIRQSSQGVFVDIYLYDSLSSGAGYAVSIKSCIKQLLSQTRELLANCTCDNACYKCLKHYRNQNIHGILDRKAAMSLLDWGKSNQRTSALSLENQKSLLKKLEQILQISGVQLDTSHFPLWAKGAHGTKNIVVYPAMWAKPFDESTIFVSDADLMYARPYTLKTIMNSL
jgi:hypothetical protein